MDQVHGAYSIARIVARGRHANQLSWSSKDLGLALLWPFRTSGGKATCGGWGRSHCGTGQARPRSAHAEAEPTRQAEQPSVKQ